MTAATIDDITAEELADLALNSSRLHQTEARMRTMGTTRYRADKQRSQDRAVETRSAGTRQVMTHTVKLLAAALKDSLAYKRASGGRALSANQYLRQLPPEKAALICCRTLFDAISMGTPHTSVAMKVGARIEDEVRFTAYRRAMPSHHARMMRRLAKHGRDYR